MDKLLQLAELIHERNLLEERISEITSRPASIGHLGEFIASSIFGVRLAENANHKSIDGWFESGPLQGRSVNIKWYAKHEGILDMCVDSGPDFYLVLAGPRHPATRAVGPRPWLIEHVFLMEDSALRGLLSSKIGIATSVRRDIWTRCEIFPNPNPELCELSASQVSALNLFGVRRP
ncbi:MAG: hypothetical protein JST35_04995 [Armatimonadetes bacterium]|nr:hypothetical protein [Armatimonadota bacterium]